MDTTGPVNFGKCAESKQFFFTHQVRANRLEEELQQVIEERNGNLMC